MPINPVLLPRCGYFFFFSFLFPFLFVSCDQKYTEIRLPVPGMKDGGGREFEENKNDHP